MNRLHDKIAILCLTAFIFSKENYSAMPVVAILLAITLSCLSQYLPKSKISLASEIIYGITCLISPVFCCALALLISDILWDNRYKLLGIPLIATIINIQYFSNDKLLLILSSLIFSFLLWKRTSKMEYLEKTLIETRDSSAEVTMLLIEKNKHLCETQDNEIYLATLKERNRIAREIHDNVGHMLTRSILQLGALKIINKDKTVGESLESVKQTLDSAMTSIRTSVHNLHDDSIDLKYTIEECVLSMRDNYDIKLDMDFSKAIPKNVKLCFIGVAKESLSNIIKHSNAEKINIILREHPAFYQLAIEDNGKGNGIIENSGIGLSNIRDRVNAIRGNVTFTPSKNGFKVFVSIPKDEQGENK